MSVVHLGGAHGWVSRLCHPWKGSPSRSWLLTARAPKCLRHPFSIKQCSFLILFEKWMGTLWTQGQLIEGFSIHHLSSNTIYTPQSHSLVYIILVKSSFSLVRIFLWMIYQSPSKKCAASESSRLFGDSLFCQQSMIDSEITIFSWKTTLSLSRSFVLHFARDIFWS